MKAHHKHHNLARRKMGHIIDEIYTALLHYGGGEVDLRILRQAEGLRMFAKSEFAPEHLEDIRRMGELLQPEVRSGAIVEMYWELAGEDQYSSESEMALVGQMADEARMEIDGQRVSIELFVSY